jgi:hypothetical protein
MSTAREAFNRMMKVAQMVDWYNSRPPLIRELISQYPFGNYKIKSGAPYAIACPGTEVEILCYERNGNITVLIPIGNLKPSAITHILPFPESHRSRAIAEEVSPEYLERIE